MLYLLDASALITAHNTYMALHRVPEYWGWLIHHGEAGNLKMPRPIYEEVEDGNDALADWMKDGATKDALLLQEGADAVRVRRVMAFYGPNPTEADLITIGRDPFLIAAALADPADRRVVSAEVSKPGRTGARRHIPDICADCAIQCLSPVPLLTELDFSTGWAA